MLLKFGRYIHAYDNGDYFCRPCDRWFSSESAVLAHCRSTSAHEWCERCERVFVTEYAKQKHKKLSGFHSVCYFCDDRPDFASKSQLREHHNEVHFPCQKCNLSYRTYSAFTEHVLSEHFGCEVCLRMFDNQNNLDQHMKAHEDKNLECPACERSFARVSYVLLHLERSRCTSIKKIKRLASEFDLNSYFGTTFYSTTFINDNSKYFCENCALTFDRLSSLFQHVEDTPHCSDFCHQSDLPSLAEYIFDNICD